MWTIVLSVVALWCLLSVPLAMIVGRFIGGVQPAQPRVLPERPVMTHRGVGAA